MLEHSKEFINHHVAASSLIAPFVAGLGLGLASFISSVATTNVLFGSLGNAFVGGFMYGAFYSIVTGMLCALGIELANTLFRQHKHSVAYAYSLPAASILIVALLIVLGNIYLRLVGH